jgi:hypothetical protein
MRSLCHGLRIKSWSIAAYLQIIIRIPRYTGMFSFLVWKILDEMRLHHILR